jgi:hypothetical protein
MRTLTRIGRTAVILAAMLGAPAPARADESDNFTCRARLTRDSLGALDGLMNARIQAALDRANRRGATACGANCLVSELQKHIGASALDPRTLVPHARFEKWITRQPAVDRCHLKFSDTIYGGRPYDQPWLFPFHGRVIFVADSILLSGRVVGLDKINHFIREGLEHWRDATGRGRDIASILDEELGSPAGKFRWTEYGLKGWSLTGVLAYADLAAGYSGFQFWTDLLSTGESASYVAWDASSGRFVQTRPFTFATYVNDAWDEGINYSTFQPGLGREVSAALARRALSLPVADCRSLASLPDARLYVNPACLLPDLEGLERVEPVQDHADLRRTGAVPHGPKHEKPLAPGIHRVGLSAVGGRRRQAGEEVAGLAGKKRGTRFNGHDHQTVGQGVEERPSVRRPARLDPASV